MQGKKNIHLDIVLISYNTVNLLKPCLKSLYEMLNNNPAIRGHLFIIDNFSKDGSVEFVRKNYMGIKIIKNKSNLGYARAVNIGIKDGRSPYILVLNSDLEFRDYRLLDLIEFMAKHDRTGIAGPQLLYEDGRWQKSYENNSGILSSLKKMLGMVQFRKCLDKFLYRWDFDRPRYVGMIPGAVMLIRRSMVEDIGGFDEDFFFYAEDEEFCHRARIHGYRVIFFPQFHVVHRKGGSTPDSLIFLKKMLAADTLFHEKIHTSVCYRRAFAIIELITALYRYIILHLLLPIPGWKWPRCYIEIMKIYINHYITYAISLRFPKGL